MGSDAPGDNPFDRLVDEAATRLCQAKGFAWSDLAENVDDWTKGRSLDEPCRDDFRAQAFVVISTVAPVIAPEWWASIITAPSSPSRGP